MVVFATEDPVRKTPCTMRDAMMYYLVNERTRKMPVIVFFEVCVREIFLCGRWGLLYMKYESI